MNNVNSISQMNSMVCEHSSLISHEGKRPQSVVSGEKGPEGTVKSSSSSNSTFTNISRQSIIIDTKEYPLLPPNDSCPTSPGSSSPQSIRSSSQLSEFSYGRCRHHSPDSPEDDDRSDASDGSERSMSSPRGRIPPPHPGPPHPQSPHAVFLRPFSECNNKNSPNHHHLA